MRANRIAYAYASRTTRISPLSCAPLTTQARSRSDMDDARIVVENIVPFLTDKKSQLLYKSMDEVVRELWTRIEDVSL